MYNNSKIAEILEEIGNLLEIDGANFFRVNAYRRAAQTIAHYPQEMSEIVLTDIKDVEEIPGIGKDLSAKIVELVLEGRCEYYEQLKAKFPPGLLEMLRLRGVGPKKVQMFFITLGLHSIEDLKKAAEAHRLRDLPKMGEKSELDILKAIEEDASHDHKRRLLHDAFQEANAFVSYLKGCSEIAKIDIAGSLRRRLETVGDVDILCIAKNAEKVFDFYLKYPEISTVIGRGPTKSSVILKSGLQVDLRVLPAESFGAALHYFTGSKTHNIRIRDLAKQKNLKVNEYGVFKIKGDKEIFMCGAKEEEIFESVGLPFVPPELREDRGEIEWALNGKPFPKLVELEDLKADLHCHSEWSDGSESIEAVATAYRDAGYAYMALTDHSKAVGITQGMDSERIQEQWKEIDRLNTILKPFVILKGSEVDILRDGSLDFPDEILKKLDIVVASVHLNFKMSLEDQTKRIIRAIESGFIKILGHPTGRLINERVPFEADMKKIFQAAKTNHVALEINASPSRMDLNDTHVKMAKELGCSFVISTDSHHSSQMQFQKYGVYTARRGWLTKEDILNSRPLPDLLKFWKKS